MVTFSKNSFIVTTMKNRMKKIHAFCLIALFLLCNGSLQAQQSQYIRDDVAHAVGVLKGIYDDYSTTKAFDIINDVAEKDSDAYAMNVMGLLYMEGIGIEKNGELAISWLDKAGTSGFCDAYHNLGVIYKHGKCNEKQNFKLAYETFLKGALCGSDICRYDVGFMLYKGLGCKQDYHRAFDFFQMAADNDNPHATYMLGLCYRNGYGTEKDEETGMMLLNKVANHGYTAAIEEVMRTKPENSFDDICVSDTLFSSIPPNMPEIITHINDTSLLNGVFEGFVVMYDWSGQHILGEKPVIMKSKRVGEELSGLIVLGTDSVVFTADIMADGSLQFKKSYVNLYERYTFNGKEKYKLNSAALDIWEDRIKGKLSLYSLSQREPERPMYMELYRGIQNGLTAENTNGYIKIAPNPFTDEFKATFKMADNAIAAARIFDKTGTLIWQQSLGALEKGSHEITLCPNVKPGTHVLNISAGKQVLRTIIVKKGGEI